jgi:uncharacterized protein YlzI (FlbEa/FlbD family)
MPTYIRFSEDHSIVVSESFAEIANLIREAEAAQIPLFEATRIDGPKMLINANGIRSISEGKKKDGDRKH